MKKAAGNTIKIIKVAYLAIVCILVMAEMSGSNVLITIFKPLLIPSLAFLYYLSSEHRNKLYFLGLLFAVTANVILLSTDSSALLYGGTVFVIYRILMIALVVKATAKLRWRAILIAVLPFLFFYCYLIDLTEATFVSNLYPAIANGVLMSLLAGISLSNYIFEESSENSWLMISSLLFVILSFIFVVDSYFVVNASFRPLSIITFAAAHFAFYRYLLLNEEKKNRYL